MSLAKWLSCLPFIFLLAGCELISPQLPFGSTQYPAFQSSSVLGAQPSSTSQSGAQSQVQMSAGQRGQYLWDKALQGMAMGGAIAGPYGAGGGLIIGLIAGLFTADSYYTQLNGQIQSEQDKDKALEAKIDQELQRQRDLDSKIAASSGNSTQQTAADPPPQAGSKPNAPQPVTVAMKETSTTGASTSKKESAPSMPPSPFKNVEVKDINGDGVPDLWIYYNPLKPGEIVRQEEATHWDGKVDSWSYFKDGKLVRREVDSKGAGVADTVYYYDNDQIVREERDEHGRGYPSLRILYQNGRRARVEEDSNGSGKIDHWIYYDTSVDGEVVLKEERDLNGDGSVDMWSYYENGRLVRRDLNAVGLELVSKQEGLPSSPDPNQTAGPQSVSGDKGQTIKVKTKDNSSQQLSHQ
jgi:hypothetical protein